MELCLAGHCELSPSMMLEHWTSKELSELQALLNVKEEERITEECQRAVNRALANAHGG